LLAKWVPCLGFLGRKYLFYDTSYTHRLWLIQNNSFFYPHFTISEDGRVIGEAGGKSLFPHKDFVNIPNLCEFEIPLGHGFRTKFDTITNGGEKIEISFLKQRICTGWDILLPANLDDYRVLAGLALVYADYANMD